MYFRNSLGRNDNPNAVEFESAFKRLLICHPIITSVDHNVITNSTGILTVSSSTRHKKTLPSNPDQQPFNLEIEISYEDVMLRELDGMDEYLQHMSAYIALCIEEEFRKKIKQNRYKCIACANILSSAEDKVDDDLLAKRNVEYKQPSTSTLKLVIFSNAVMNMYSEEHVQGNSRNAIWKTIRDNIDMNDLYDNFFMHHGQGESISDAHKLDFISHLVKIYINLKSKQFAKKFVALETAPEK